MTLEQYAEYCKKNRDEIQKEMYRLADLEVNGSDSYYEQLGNYIESHPIYTLGLRRS